MTYISKQAVKLAKQSDFDIRLALKNALTNGQKLLAEFVEQVVCTPLGPQYSDMSFEDCQRNLILYRLTKKFVVPTEVDKEERRRKSVLAMLHFDANGITEFEPSVPGYDPYVRSILYQVRAYLYDNFSDYRLDYRQFNFPSNKVSYQLGDETSLEEKLSNKNCWEVTFPCLEDFCQIAYRNLQLKRVAKLHIGAVTKQERKDLYNKYRDRKNCGYLIFKHLLAKYVLTIVPGGRISTVPKDNDVDRVIIVEPFCNMIVQRCNAFKLIKVANSVGLDVNLVDAQDLHKSMILDYSNATIDFSNASNSVFLSVIEWLWPPKVVRKLRNARSEHVTYEDEIIPLNMLSAMGNGFTFEVMTLTLLAIARIMDTGAMVFGDDVIIDADVAPQFIEVCYNIGFNTNTKKTFITGAFRESCGGFASHGLHFTSFDMEYPENWFDLVVCINKIGILARESSIPELHELHRNLLTVTPVLAWSMRDSSDNLQLEGNIYVDEKYLLKKRKSTLTVRKAHAARSIDVIYSYINIYHYGEPFNVLTVVRKTRQSKNEYSEIIRYARQLFEPGSNGCKSKRNLSLPWFPKDSVIGVPTSQTFDTICVEYHV